MTRIHYLIIFVCLVSNSVLADDANNATNIIIVDTFNDNNLHNGWVIKQLPGVEGGTTLIETNQQLVARGNWRGIKPTTQYPTELFTGMEIACKTFWSVPPRKTMEMCGDVVSISSPEVGTVIGCNRAPECGYWMFHGNDFVVLNKYCHLEGNLRRTTLFADRVIVPRTHVTLSLSLTDQGDGLKITCRVIDIKKGTVLYEHHAMDTPQTDVYFQGDVGIPLFGADNHTETIPYPIKHGNALMFGICQSNAMMPDASDSIEAVFDNLIMKIYQPEKQ